MNKVAPLAIVGALSLVGTSVVTPLVSSAAPTSLPRLYNCSQAQSRPSTIVLSCADANRELVAVHWNTWGGATATATGTLRWNDCTPTCAGGHWHQSPLRFSARALTTVAGVRLYTQLVGPAGAWGSNARIWTLPTKPL